MKSVGKRIVSAVICVVFLFMLSVSAFLFEAEKRTKEDKESKLDEEQVECIIVTYNYVDSSQMEHMDEIVEQINTIIREEIGVALELLPVHTFDTYTDYPLWISQGTQIDLMLLNYQDITTYIDKDMLLPLDSLLHSSGKDILEIIESGQALGSGSIVRGKTYGLNLPSEYRGNGGGIWIPERYLEEVSFPFEEKHVYGKEELSVLWEKLKSKYPFSYPLGQITSGNTFTTYSFFGQGVVTAASGLNTGYLREDGTVADFYESELYYDFLEQMRDWYEAGYIYPDSAFTDAMNLDLLRDGIILSIPLSSSPGMFSESGLNEKLVCLRTNEVTYGPASSRGIFWTIPSTSAAPQAAMRFLNLMYSDERIVNLLMWGIEGVDYVIKDAEKGIITYQEEAVGGKDRYYNPLGIYGNPSLSYILNTDENKEALKEYSALARPVGMEYADFTFLSSPVSVEIAKVQNVISRYLPVLESGSADLESNYADFVQELKEAGVDKIIAEKQRQLDEWRSGKN